MIGEPDTLFWIAIAGLAMLGVGIFGLGATAIAIVELALGGDGHGNDERQS